MAYVPAQTLVVMNADLAALVAQRDVLKGVRAAIPAGVNPRDIQLLDKQIKEIRDVERTLRARIKRAS